MATRNRITRDDESDDDSLERKFICEICSVASKSKINLRKHKQRFHEDERSYTCDHESCTKTIIGLSNYCLHRKSHESSPAPCSYCGKVLSNEHMGRHMRACPMNQELVKDFECLLLLLFLATQLNNKILFCLTCYLHLSAILR